MINTTRNKTSTNSVAKNKTYFIRYLDRDREIPIKYVEEFRVLVRKILKTNV